MSSLRNGEGGHASAADQVPVGAKLIRACRLRERHLRKDTSNPRRCSGFQVRMAQEHCTNNTTGQPLLSTLPVPLHTPHTTRTTRTTRTSRHPPPATRHTPHTTQHTPHTKHQTHHTHTPDTPHTRIKNILEHRQGHERTNQPRGLDPWRVVGRNGSTGRTLWRVLRSVPITRKSFGFS